MDLLTTLAHEMGHLLDYDRALDGVIIDTLPASIRRMASGTGVNDWALVDVLVSEHLSKRRH